MHVHAKHTKFSDCFKCGAEKTCLSTLTMSFLIWHLVGRGKPLTMWSFNSAVICHFWAKAKGEPIVLIQFICGFFTASPMVLTTLREISFRQRHWVFVAGMDGTTSMHLGPLCCKNGWHVASMCQIPKNLIEPYL